MSTVHGRTAMGPWESALWGLLGLDITTLDDGRALRTVKMPTMHSWPLIGAGWLAMATVGGPQSWLAYCLIALVGLLLTEYTDARAVLKESGVSGTSRWREAGTWVSFVAGVGYHAYQVFTDHDLAAVKPLSCTLGLLVLWVVKYVAHQIQRALRLIAEIRTKLDTINDGTSLPDPEPEPPVCGNGVAVVVRLDDRREKKLRERGRRHRKAA